MRRNAFHADGARTAASEFCVNHSKVKGRLESTRGRMPTTGQAPSCRGVVFSNKFAKRFRSIWKQIVLESCFHLDRPIWIDDESAPNGDEVEVATFKEGE